MKLENDYTWLKVVSANLFFHFVVLGLAVRYAFFPEMGNESWLMLLGMTMIMAPIVAFFLGWDMRIGASYVDENAQKYKRMLVMFIFAGMYISMLLKWFGVIGPLHA